MSKYQQLQLQKFGAIPSKKRFVLNLMDCLNKIRTLLIEYLSKNKVTFESNLKITDDYDIIEYKDIEDTHLCGIFGKTMINVLEWNNSVNGIKFANKFKIEYIAIRLKNEFGEKLPIESVIYTFLHELSHTVTTPRTQNSSKLTKGTKDLQPFVKNENKKIPNHHPIDFYKNLSKILRISDELDIYKLPKQYRNFNLKNIMRYDTMINPNDKMSLGFSNLISI
tara:strand:- start:484 stop:1152 length:669 start_codon:yes stop_codon:yes gene_type:complete